MFFAKNMNKNIQVKTVKTAKTTGNLIGNKIADKSIKVSIISPQNNLGMIYISRKETNK